MSAISQAPVVYPDSDGKRMAENDLQYRWIVTIRGNLDVLFRDRSDVYVAADHLIYVKEGDPKLRQAPDVYVAFGRPKRDRGSYKVWEEAGVFPQVIFEILSPGNRPREMAKKLLFYERYGADEYYVYDPDRDFLECHRRGPNGRFERIVEVNGYVSPWLGIRFDTSGAPLVIRRPDGTPFLSQSEVEDLLRQERQRADAAQQENDRLKAKLRAAGIDPDAP